ncbi:cell division protein FtsK [Mycobacterium sp. M1]|uniref:Cell division protein FtsK n=1 Tax=Mycolicibacter acidiphilus TaxID=2835306 RepID=A0ABS5REA3_9MYCO|nr:cell division protein FtsK [Mycolicibacter acidiphilus]MBS9532618.1 cell division protein FtsK [Mycolicibacter acidiphilus]
MGVVDHILARQAAKDDAERKIATARRINEEKIAAAQQVADHRAAIAAAQQAQRDQQRRAEQVQRDRIAAERARLSAPVTQRVILGDPPKVMPVTHWKAPAAPVKGASTPPPIFFLMHGGGSVLAPRLMVEMRPSLADDKPFQGWVRQIKPLIDESLERYPVLTKLRDRQWWASICESSGLGITHTADKPWRAGELTGTRKVTTVVLPTIIGVRIAPDGLRIKVKHRMGDAIDSWVKALPRLRAALSAAGVKADRLRVYESSGSFVLAFNDAPENFPTAVAPPPVAPVETVDEAIAAYPQLNWTFGVDARGNVLSAKLATNPHIALIAETGGGKSVLAATILESLRPFASCWIFDGKGSDHPASLGSLSNVSWISKTAAEHIVGARWLWDEMNERYMEADRRKAAGKPDTAFSFPPTFVLIDELPSLRGQVAKADTKDKGELFDFYVNDLLQKGRQARIHLCLISQSLRVDALPGWWQENLSRIIFLGSVSSRSLMSDAIPDSAKEDVVSLSAQIPDTAKGRGIYLERGQGGAKARMFQSFWGYAPGTTSLAHAPNAEVKAAWEIAAAQADEIPRLYDRIGIKVEDAEWRKLPMAELAETPTVIVSDEGGVIPEMSEYDPLSPDFLGRVSVAAAAGRARGRGSVAPTAVPKQKAAEPVPVPTPEPVSEDAVRRKAIEMGLIDPDEPADIPAAPEPEPDKPETKTTSTGDEW